MKDEQRAKEYSESHWDIPGYSYEQSYLDGLQKGRELEAEKAMRFAEWCQNGPYMWHGFFCGWFHKFESIHIKENIKTTEELYNSKEFLTYLNTVKQ